MNSSRNASPRITPNSLLPAREHLTRIPKRRLREAGWTKARKVVKVARRDGTEFDCAPWVRKANELPKEEFKRDVDRYLIRKETEPWKIIYFKRYKSQLLVVESALEIAAQMLSSDKSRSYSLEMICDDFLVDAVRIVEASKIWTSTR
jgi:hypothetical protein